MTRSSTKFARRLAAAGLALVALGMAACSSGGGSESSDPVAQVVSDAASKTGSSSAHVVMDMTIRSSSLPGQVKITTSGDVGRNGRQAELSMQLESGEQSRQVQVRLVGDTVYLRQPGTEQWQRFAASAISGQQGFGASNPISGLDYLRGVSNSVTRKGPETVRGVDTTRYHAEIDVRKSAERLSGEQRRRVEAVSQLGVEELPTDVWIDDEGRIRREFFTMRMKNGEQIITVGMTMELYDFGLPVRVQAPPDDQVVPGDPSSLGAVG